MKLVLRFSAIALLALGWGLPFARLLATPEPHPLLPPRPVPLQLVTLPISLLSSAASVAPNAIHDGSLVGTFSGNRTEAGNSTKDAIKRSAGVISAGRGKVALKPFRSDAIQYVSEAGSDSNDGLSPGTARATLNAAGLALPSSGGIINVLPGVYAISSQVTALDTASKPTDLQIAATARFNITESDSKCVFPIANSSGVDVGGAPFSANQFSVGGFYVASTAKILDLFCNADVTGAQELLHISGTHVIGASGETITGAIYDLQGLFTNTVLRDNYTEDISTAFGTVRVLRLQPGTRTLKLSSDILFDNDNFDCTGGAGCIAEDIEGVSGSTVAGIISVGGAVQHGGPGEPTLLIDGHGVISGIYGISYDHTHLEARAGGASCAFQIIDAAYILFDNPTPSGNATNAFCVSQSSRGLTYGIGILNARSGGGYIHLIDNQIDSYTSTAFSISGYFYAWPAVYDGNTSTLQLGSLTSSGTQCLQANAMGVISGTGSACGNGAGGRTSPPRVSRAVTGTTSTDTLLGSDAGNPVNYLTSLAVATSLPTPAALGNLDYATVLRNKTSGSSTTVTVTPAHGWTINGFSRWTIYKHQACTVDVDSSSRTNWLATCGGSGVVYNTASSVTNSNVRATNMVLGTTERHDYLLMWTVDLTAAGSGCTGEVTVTVNAIFTDPNASVAVTHALGKVTLASAGAGGTVGFVASGVDNILAKSGTPVQYSTSGYSGGCTANPTYQVIPTLVQQW